MASKAKQWIERLISSRSFSNVSSDTLEDIARRMEAVPASAGEVIVREGEAADYYYIIQEGRCRIVNRESVLDDTMELATLGPGTSFGEEGLIRGGVRGATVEMVTDGALVRLGKDDFVELIQKPLLNRVTVEEAKRRVNEGAQWIDLRPMKEFAKIAIEGSQNIPGPHLRAMIDRIDASRSCLLCSDSTAESALGAFILAEKGYDAAYLDCSVIEYLSATGEADPEALRSIGVSLEDGIIELPEEFASLSTDSFIIKEEDVEEDADEFINLEPEHPIRSDVDRDSLDGLLATVRGAVSALIESEQAKLHEQYEAEIAALQKKYEQRIQETKDRYRAHFQEKEKRLKRKYQEALDKYRQKS